MTAVDFDLTQANGTLYADEVALVNTFRRLKNSLPTGCGEVHFSVEVVDHCGRSITTVFEERASVDEDAPTIVDPFSLTINEEFILANDSRAARLSEVR